MSRAGIFRQIDQIIPISSPNPENVLTILAKRASSQFLSRIHNPSPRSQSLDEQSISTHSLHQTSHPIPKLHPSTSPPLPQPSSQGPNKTLTAPPNSTHMPLQTSIQKALIHPSHPATINLPPSPPYHQPIAPKILQPHRHPPSSPHRTPS